MQSASICVLGIRDEAHRMLICVTWKDSNRFLAKFVREKTYAKKIDESVSVHYRDRNHHCNGFLSHHVAGANGETHGLRFSYEVDSVA